MPCKRRAAQHEDLNDSTTASIIPGMEGRILLYLLLLTGALTGAASARAQGSILLNRVTNAYPSYSPDGQAIAYMSNAGGDFDIYVVEPDRGARRRLTDAPGRDGTPAWSPDGRRIAFQSFRDGRSQIYVMDADGGSVRNLSNIPYHDEHPFWSSDGARILFASDRSTPEGEERSYDLYAMDSDGSNIHRITATPEIETYPSWSPDGSHIVCRRVLADGNWEVVLLDERGNFVRNLSNHPAVDGWPVWSPDGSRIVFTSERTGSADLWMVNADGTGLRRITEDPERDERQPWWSPDGSRIVFASYEWFTGEPFYEASEIRVLALESDESFSSGAAAPMPRTLASWTLQQQEEQ